MDAPGEDRDRAARRIVGRIDHVLVIERDRERLEELRAVIGLENPLWPIGERAVADEDAEAADEEEAAMLLRQLVLCDADRQRIVGTAPAPALEAETKRSALIDILEGPAFRVAIADTEAAEEA